MSNFSFHSTQDESLYYYCIIFTFVFLPLFLTFISFNTFIAREIWKRRKVPGSGANKQKKINEDSSTSEVGGKTTNDTNSTSLRNGNSSRDTISTITQQSIQNQQQQQRQSVAHNDYRCNERHRRQMRMFKVILVLMCVFIMFRLPNWIFLLYKLNFFIEPRTGWLINYSVSIIGILNSMVNPFLYTFLSETIRFTSHIRGACYKFCKLCRPNANSEQAIFGGAATPAKIVIGVRGNDNGGVYLGN